MISTLRERVIKVIKVIKGGLALPRAQLRKKAQL